MSIRIRKKGEPITLSGSATSTKAKSSVTVKKP